MSSDPGGGVGRRTGRELLRFGRAALSAVADAFGQRGVPAAPGGHAMRRLPAPPRVVVPTVAVRLQVAYAPVADGNADPGEVV